MTTLSIAALRRMAKHALADADPDTAGAELREWVRDNAVAVGAAIGRSPAHVETGCAVSGHLPGHEWTTRLVSSLDVAAKERKEQDAGALALAAHDEASVLGASAKVDSGGAWLSMRLLALTVRAAEKAGYDLLALDFGGESTPVCVDVARLGALMRVQKGEHDVNTGNWLVCVSRTSGLLSLQCGKRGYRLRHYACPPHRCLLVTLASAADIGPYGACA